MKYTGSHHHVFKEVVRKKGNRVRYKCDTCIKIGPWVRFVDEKDVPQTAYEKMTVTELRHAAKDAGIIGYSKMTKHELVDTLAGAP
jgi:epoxyqueuosine reductase QueG